MGHILVNCRHIDIFQSECRESFFLITIQLFLRSKKQENNEVQNKREFSKYINQTIDLLTI